MTLVNNAKAVPSYCLGILSGPHAATAVDRAEFTVDVCMQSAAAQTEQPPPPLFSEGFHVGVRYTKCRAFFVRHVYSATSASEKDRG